MGGISAGDPAMASEEGARIDGTGGGSSVPGRSHGAGSVGQTILSSINNGMNAMPIAPTYSSSPGIRAAFAAANVNLLPPKPGELRSRASEAFTSDDESSETGRYRPTHGAKGEQYGDGIGYSLDLSESFLLQPPPQSKFKGAAAAARSQLLESSEERERREGAEKVAALLAHDPRRAGGALPGACSFRSQNYEDDDGVDWLAEPRHEMSLEERKAYAEAEAAAAWSPETSPRQEPDAGHAIAGPPLASLESTPPNTNHEVGGGATAHREESTDKATNGHGGAEEGVSPPLRMLLGADHPALKNPKSRMRKQPSVSSKASKVSFGPGVHRAGRQDAPTRQVLSTPHGKVTRIPKKGGAPDNQPSVSWRAHAFADIISDEAEAAREASMLMLRQEKNRSGGSEAPNGSSLAPAEVAVPEDFAVESCKPSTISPGTRSPSAGSPSAGSPSVKASHRQSSGSPSRADSERTGSRRVGGARRSAGSHRRS